MNRRRNAQRSSLGQQESGFLSIATTPRLLGWRRAPKPPPGTGAESTCSNGDERPPVGEVVGANTNHLPSKPCLAALGQMFPTPSAPALRPSPGTSGEPRLDPHIKVWRRFQNNEGRRESSEDDSDAGWAGSRELKWTRTPCGEGTQGAIGTGGSAHKSFVHTGLHVHEEKLEIKTTIRHLSSEQRLSSVLLGDSASLQWFG